MDKNNLGERYLVMFELSKFNKYREDNRREVKRARNGLPDSLWSTYSAFVNCYGGVIILGVEENKDGSWRTTGLQGEEKLLKDFWNNIRAGYSNVSAGRGYDYGSSCSGSKERTETHIYWR